MPAVHHHAPDRLGAGARPHPRPHWREIAGRLRNGFIREPSVAVEI